MNAGTAVRAVLFDADGVLQYVPGGFAERLAGVHGLRDERAAEFARALFAMEVGAACWQVAFAPALAALIADWQLPVTLAQFLDVWQHVALYDGMRELIASLRARGILCGLATNQHDERARYMSNTLGYAQLFDEECYSCLLGTRKPAPRFFAAAAARMGWVTTCMPTRSSWSLRTSSHAGRSTCARAHSRLATGLTYPAVAPFLTWAIGQ